jgi:hypothetical protein
MNPISRSTLLFVTLILFSSVVMAQTPGADVRLTRDFPGGGYVSSYTIATGTPYTDVVLNECSISRGRENEPSIAVDPRNTNVLIGSSNDYCGVYWPKDQNGNPIALGPIWLGYYRSENGGSSFISSLVPGYPEDTSPYAELAHVRTASSGDPVVAWDGHGRVYMGSESSGDPAGTKKTLGDVWVAVFDNPAGENGVTINDGKRFVRSEIVQRGSSAPNLLGNFQDKTSIEVDRTGGPCDGTVYFSWVRFSGNGGVAAYLSRSTDHGASWSAPTKLTESVQLLQTPDIAVTGNGHVYVVWNQTQQAGQPTNAVAYAKSTNCGQSFTFPAQITSFIRYRPLDVLAPEPIFIPTKYLDDPQDEEEQEREKNVAATIVRDCGDFDSHCASGYTFFRMDAIGTQARATADQYDTAHEWVYILYDATKPGTQVPTGKTYGSVGLGTGSQAGIFFTRLDGTTGTHTTPVLIDNQPVGHQIYPDISADGGVLHAVWYDSRLDPSYSPARPIGNDANGVTGPSIDAWSAKSTDAGATWTGHARLSDVSSNPNYEQFSNRTIPFAGDYLWITSLGDFSFATWTDYRNTVPGTDPREGGAAEDNDNADVKQCRTFDTTLQAWTNDTCPHDGGLDQDIFGDHTP